MNKHCKTHGLTPFAPTSRRCRKCAYEAVKRRRKLVKDRLVAMHGGKYQKCGYNKSKRALSFHHRNPDDKQFQICGPTVLGWDRLVKESNKCDLLCANCHMEVEELLALPLS